MEEEADLSQLSNEATLPLLENSRCMLQTSHRYGMHE